MAERPVSHPASPHAPGTHAAFPPGGSTHTATAEPIVAPAGQSPAAASSPHTTLDDRWHVYDENPAPWWIALLWLSFFAFGAAYLYRHLLQ